jgi:hypothetical protein
MKFEVDSSLDRGIEFSPLTYLNSISESIDLINDFYDDFDKQSYWKFTEKTGLHINIGFKEKMDWNVLKGVLFLSDDPSTSTLPKCSIASGFVFAIPTLPVCVMRIFSDLRLAPVQKLTPSNPLMLKPSQKVLPS